MIARILLISLVVSALPVAAETRVWRSADGTKSIEARFVKRDEAGVTVLRSDHREVTIPLEKIHRDDRAWLEASHPLASAMPPPAATFVLDLVEFGDSRAQVLEKLKASEAVKSTLPESMLARTGLNGVFHTLGKVGGLTASLSFDWCENGGLKEITLQTTPLSGEGIEARLAACWKECIELLTSRYGPPIHANGKLGIAALANHSMSATHLWKLESRGTAMLGPVRDGGEYQIAIRLTTEDIQPVFIPAPVPTDR